MLQSDGLILMMLNYFYIQHCHMHGFRPYRLVHDGQNRKVCSIVRFVNKRLIFLLQVVAGVIGSCHAQASLIKGLLDSRSRSLGSKEPW